MLNNFIYSKTKALFEEALNNGEVLDEAIVFIEDTKEIWNHGTYFDGNKVDLSNIEESIQNILDTKQDTIPDLDTIREGALLGATAVDDTIDSFDTKVVTLKIHLLEGWYWVSFYVNTTLQELQTALGTNGVSISTTSAGGISEADLINTYDSSTNSWSGNITELDFSKMYMIETSSECDIYLTGEQINPADLSISLQEGWNWIDYPVSQEMSLSNAIPAGALKDGDVINSQFDGIATYYDRTLSNGNYIKGWSGTLSTLKPGYGYMFNSVDNKNFTYPDTYYKPFGNVEVTSELGESTTKAASLDLVTKVSEESKQYVDDKIDGLNKVTLTIDLVAGTNWVSFYVNTTLEELQNSLGTNGVSISTTSTGGLSEADLVNTYTDGVWSGKITNLDFSKMYRIEVIEAATIEVSGELLNPEDVIITLNQGWTWIGYPSNVGVDINQAFNFKDGSAPAEGDVIKSQNNGSADYAFGQWWGTLRTMVPGVGYMYRNTSSETITFTYPTQDLILESKISSKQDTLVSGTNIKTVNGESILGSGDITISTQYPIIEYASDNTTVTISPNVFHVWGEVVDLNIEFNDPEDYSVLNEYIFQFASGSTAPALSLPENLMWTGGEAPVIESNTIYQISIVNKCATVLAFPVTV